MSARASPSSRSPRADDAARSAAAAESQQLGEWFGEVARKLTGVWSRVGYPPAERTRRFGEFRAALEALCDERVAAEEAAERALAAREHAASAELAALVAALEDVRDDAPASDEFEGPSRTSRTSLERGSYFGLYAGADERAGGEVVD